MISAVILTKNEEKNIKDCLEAVKWCEEIVIIDDYSEDQTVSTCEMSNVKCQIFQRHLDKDFAAQRNYGLEKARGPARHASQGDAGGEWVLFLDADERVTEDLKEEILHFVQNDKYNGFYLKRKDFLFGKRLNHGESGNIKLLRLAKKDSGIWGRSVHETWQIKGLIGELTNPLLHYPHQKISEFLHDINIYTDINAQVFYQQEIKVRFWQIFIYPFGKFIKNYFFKLGILDKTPGFIHAVMMSFHSFLTRAKLWVLWHSS
ncbi:MAG: glycosyltransferase family 2 protein [Candidatus Gottesmanbacteria bacterium]